MHSDRPNSRGDRSTRQRIAAVVREAAELAAGRLEQRGLPPLPSVTPHRLRRTYISIALLANGFDVKWVMAQVGHADSKMTMDVYAQLEQRADRSHGAQFDANPRWRDPDSNRGHHDFQKARMATSSVQEALQIDEFDGMIFPSELVRNMRGFRRRLGHEIGLVTQSRRRLEVTGSAAS